MVARAAAALEAAGASRVVVVGGDRDAITGLGLEHVADRYPHQGPLGGVITALLSLQQDVRGGPGVLVTLPCDVIAPSAESVRTVLAAVPGDASHHECDVVVPVAQDEPQWLHAAWRVECFEALLRLFEQGIRAPRSAVGRLRAVYVEMAESGWFADADEPGDLPAQPSR